MAINTREKRQAVAGIPAIPLGPNVTPNSSKDIEWRQEAAWGYPGIQADVPPQPVHFTIVSAMPGFGMKHRVTTYSDGGARFVSEGD